MNVALVPNQIHSSRTKKSVHAITANDFASLFVALVAVAGAAVLLLTISDKEEDAFALVNHTRDVFRNSQQMIISVAQADMSVRNFLLTNNPKYMTEYRRVRARLMQEAVEATISARRPISRYIVQSTFWPRLNNLIALDDVLINQKALSVPSLQKQERARHRLDSILESLEQRQLKLLQERSDNLSTLTAKVSSTRLLIVLIALIAITFSIFTLRSVMRKDRAKILSLQSEVDRTKAAELIAYEALAEAHQSNALKAQFMANISHEIRTPMTGILGTAELLCNMPLDNESMEYSHLLLSSSKELLSVLNDLLNFSRLQRSEVTLNADTFSLQKVVSDVVARNRAAARDKNLSLDLTMEPSLPNSVLADEDKIAQVLQTLLSNAIKFTEEGGLQVSVECSSNIVRISVTDTGIGIDAEGLKKLFLPFVQVDGSIRRNFGGAGLSLYIAKRFVQMMNGQIEVLSEPGKGSIFWFTFSTGVLNG